MSLGEFIQPLSAQQERLAQARYDIKGEPALERGLASLSEAIVSAPARFAQGQKFGREMALRERTKEIYQEPDLSPGQRLERIGEAAGEVGEIGLATEVLTKAPAIQQKEQREKIARIMQLSEIVETNFANVIEKTGDEKKALESTEKLIGSFIDSGLGDDVRPVLENIMQSGQPLEFKTKEGSYKILGVLPDNRRVVQKPDGSTGTLKVEGFDVLGSISPETMAAREAAKLKVKREEGTTSVALREKGYVPATLFHIQNPTFKDRIIDASDTDQSFIKLRTVPNKDVESLTALENTQEQLQRSIKNLEKYGIEPDPVTGRLPLVGEFLTEMTKSPEHKQVRAEFARIVQDFRKAITGAQASFQEIGAIKATIPNLENADLETILKLSVSLNNEINQKKKIELDNLERAGFDIGLLRKEPKVLEIFDPSSKESQARTRIEAKLGRPLNAEEYEFLLKRMGR